MIQRRAHGATDQNEDRQSHLPGDRHHRVHEERRQAGNSPADRQPRVAETTKLYDRRGEISLDEVERIAI